MKTYIAPILNKHGNSSEIVKGSCGFGVENWNLDRTGARMGNWRTVVQTPIFTPAVGRRIYRRDCLIRNRCATGHQC